MPGGDTLVYTQKASGPFNADSARLAHGHEFSPFVEAVSANTEGVFYRNVLMLTDGLLNTLKM